MTLRDKLSMFFDTLLQEVDSIDNNKLKAIALEGLLTRIQYYLDTVKQAKDKLQKER